LRPNEAEFSKPADVHTILRLDVKLMVKCNTPRHPLSQLTESGWCPYETALIFRNRTMSIRGKILETGWRQYDTTLRNRTHAQLSETLRNTTLRINVEKTLNFPKLGGVLTKQNFQNRLASIRHYGWTSNGGTTFQNRIALMRLKVLICTPPGFRYATLFVDVET